MSDPSLPLPCGEAEVTRADFDEFLNIFTHELRNRLNVIGLEATDLEEQLEGHADFSRLLARVRDCSTFLKLVRDLLVPDDPSAAKLTVSEVSAKLHHRDERAQT